MAMVSPLLRPATGPATKEPPFTDIALQPVLQVAARFVKPPARVTVLLVRVELKGASV